VKLFGVKYHSGRVSKTQCEGLKEAEVEKIGNTFLATSVDGRVER